MLTNTFPLIEVFNINLVCSWLVVSCHAPNSNADELRQRLWDTTKNNNNKGALAIATKTEQPQSLEKSIKFPSSSRNWRQFRGLN